MAALASVVERLGVLARCAVWLALSALLAGEPAWPAEPVPDREHQIKAVFLFNFTHFVEWPASAFADARAPMLVCVLGEDPFGSALDEAVRGETVKGRPLEVRRYQRVEQAQSCHVLFISRSELPRIDRIEAALSGRPVLTVGDAEEFTRAGGIIRFDTVAGKIRLSINLEASKRAGLTLSSKLLRPAEIVAAGG